MAAWNVMATSSKYCRHSSSLTHQRKIRLAESKGCLAVAAVKDLQATDFHVAEVSMKNDDAR